MAEVTHACPPGDEGLTPCCGRTPFELPRTDRMTLDPALVTCKVALLAGAAHILVAVREVAPAIRERALAAAIDAWVKTNGSLTCLSPAATGEQTPEGPHGA